MPVEVGVYLPDDVAAGARAAEDAGLDSVWVGDHLLGGPVPDAAMALVGAAAATRSIAVGFGVYLPALRPLAWAAKQVATLQHLTGGRRLLLGVGTGGAGPAEFAAAGMPFSERGRRTDAFLEALPALLAGAPVRALDGAGDAEFRLEPAVAVPPVRVGGTGPAALRRTARHGDGWLAALTPPRDLLVSAAEITERALAFGRPAPRIASVVHGSPDERAVPGRHEELAGRMAAAYGMDLDRARALTVTGPPKEFAERLAEYVGSGVRTFACIPHDGGERGSALLAEVRALLNAER